MVCDREADGGEGRPWYKRAPSPLLLETRMNRRRFAIAALLSAASVVPPAGARGVMLIAPRQFPLGLDALGIARAISEAVRDVEAARYVGRLFVQEMGGERRAVDWTMVRLAEMSVRNVSCRDRSLAGSLRELRDEDFREDRTMYLDGWLFAHAEVVAGAVCTLNGPWI
jgi:hypothetical protein